jgi:hypothetical protein
MISSEFFGSRFPVGSSARRISGRLTRALARATLCCSPPESSLGYERYLVARPTRVRTSGTRFLMMRFGFLDYTLGKSHILIDIPVLQKTEILEYNADPRRYFAICCSSSGSDSDR